MAKAQKRGNREIRKPKAAKPPAAVEASTVPGALKKSFAGAPKKKS
ncbi:hypothetical protein [Oceanibaculum pacificum]|nr:hypothetical protein [Oceanibaculum pacificum]